VRLAPSRRNSPCWQVRMQALGGWLLQAIAQDHRRPSWRRPRPCRRPAPSMFRGCLLVSPTAALRRPIPAARTLNERADAICSLGPPQTRTSRRASSWISLGRESGCERRWCRASRGGPRRGSRGRLEWQRELDVGAVASWAELARREGISRARVTQIMGTRVRCGQRNRETG
jgi:hypothetical protein